MTILLYDRSSAWTSSWDNFVQQWHIRDGKLTVHDICNIKEIFYNISVCSGGFQH